MPSTALRPAPPDLPATIDEWPRYLKTDRSFNDEVEDIHKMLVPNERYRQLLYAAWDSQAVEGDTVCDDYLAAAMMREKAKNIDPNHPVANANLATIRKALLVVLRRYRQSRKQRRNMIHGEIVPNDPSDGDKE